MVQTYNNTNKLKKIIIFCKSIFGTIAVLLDVKLLFFINDKNRWLRNIAIKFEFLYDDMRHINENNLISFFNRLII